MKILELETFGRGGLAHYAFHLARSLADRGHEVTLLTTREYELEGRELPPTDADRAAPGKTLSSNSKLVSWLAAKPHPQARSDLRRFEHGRLRCTGARPDLVHIHNTNPSALVYSWLLRLVRARIVSTAHVVTPHESIPLERRVFGAIHRMSHLLVAHTAFDRERLGREFGIDSSTIEVIPHGEYGFFERDFEPANREQARQELGLEPDDQVALLFGYIREYKGMDVLLEAWPGVTKQRPSAKLLVVGDPVRLSTERRRELKTWAEQLGAIVHFSNVELRDVSRYFAVADVLVLPYRKISQSGVLYLGLALGLPVVASRIGSWEEMLEHEENALLVAPESPDELEQALVRLFEDDELRAQLATGGRELAVEHSWPAIAEKTERAFEGLLSDEP